MTFSHTECYLGGVHVGRYLVLFAKIKYGGRTWSMGAKCPHLTVISVSSHEIMCLGGKCAQLDETQYRLGSTVLATPTFKA